MLSKTEIDNLNAIQAQALADDMGPRITGVTNGQFKKPLADHLGVSYQGLKNWWRDGNRPSTLALMYMQSELERRRINKSLQNFVHTINSLRE